MDIIKIKGSELKLIPYTINNKKIIFQSPYGIYKWDNLLTKIVDFKLNDQNQFGLNSLTNNNKGLYYTSFFDKKMVINYLDFKSEQIEERFVFSNKYKDFDLIFNDSNIKYLKDKYILITYVNEEVSYFDVHNAIIDLENNKIYYLTNPKLDANNSYVVSCNDTDFLVSNYKSMTKYEKIISYNPSFVEEDTDISNILLLDLNKLKNNINDNELFDIIEKSQNHQMVNMLKIIDNNVIYEFIDLKLNESYIVYYDLKNKNKKYKKINRKYDFENYLYYCNGEIYCISDIYKNKIINLFNSNFDIVYPKGLGECNKIINNKYCIFTKFDYMNDIYISYLYDIKKKSFNEFSGTLYFFESDNILVNII